MIDLSGEWFSTYQYPSTSSDASLWSYHTLTATQEGKAVHLESGPASLSKVVLDLICDFDTGVAQGTWVEHTNPQGHYQGRVYEGTVEFNLNDAKRLDGTWEGKGKDGYGNTGVWYLSREPFTDSHGVDRSNSDG